MRSVIIAISSHVPRFLSLGVGPCGSRQTVYLRQVESVLDLVEWRQAWPSLSVRFCTSYFKRDNFNSWARAHAQLLGDYPVTCLGERALESRGRATLPV